MMFGHRMGNRSRALSLAGCALLLAPMLLARGGPQSGQTRGQTREPAGFFQYSPSQLKAYERALKGRLNERKQAAEQLGDFGNHTAWIAHREADGLAEIHQDWTDLMFVTSGEASLQVGGEIDAPYMEAPGEVRGPTAHGGAVRHLRAGDVVNVPAGVQHRFLIPAGTEITFFTMKIAKATPKRD
jgi:mannose-6-phosphate isomerase-like protein (cupin superfamily)